MCTEDLTSGEITGTWMPSGENRFEWREGPAIRAWRGRDGTGSRLVLDEVDRASGDALATLLAMTDSPESARWRNPDTNEWVRPGKNFSVIMTSNVEDLEEIPASLRDRFPVSVRIDRPPASAVERLSGDLRAPALAGSLGPLGRRVSLRSFYAFDELRGHHGAERAAELVFGSEVWLSLFLDALRIGVRCAVSVIYPELVAGRDDDEWRAWTILEGSTSRGEASCNLHDRVLEVPLGGGEQARVVRAHELMHARVSPRVDHLIKALDEVALRVLEVRRGVARERIDRSPRL